MQRTAPSRPGFTLFDLMITMTVMLVMAAVLLPQLRDDTQFRLIAASRLLSADIEFAQMSTISNPQDPIVVRLEQGTGHYWLATSADPDTPMQRPGGLGIYDVTFGQGSARDAAGVKMDLTDLDTETLAFNAQGGVADLITAPQIKLYVGLKWIKLDVSPITGSLTETTGSD